jgi:hypothetical protein
MKAKFIKASHGWLPDLPDHRDYLYAAPPHVIAKLPAMVDLRKNLFPCI